MAMNQNPPSYTGDIAAQHVDPAREYSAENQEIDFTAEQHALWADLFEGIHKPYLLEHICQEFKQGLTLLKLDPQHIPTVAHLTIRSPHGRAGISSARSSVTRWPTTGIRSLPSASS